jgi:hypothetical protein
VSWSVVNLVEFVGWLNLNLGGNLNLNLGGCWVVGWLVEFGGLGNWVVELGWWVVVIWLVNLVQLSLNLMVELVV